MAMATTMRHPSSSFVFVALTLCAVAVTSVSYSSHLPAQPRPSHRRLLQDQGGSNHAAAPASSVPVPAAAPRVAPPTGTALIPAASGRERNDPLPAPAPSALPESRDDVSRRPMTKWLYVIVLPAAGLLLLTGSACFVLPCRETAAATIGPWKTGLSGQLQKAFVTGIPKLQRSEIERACEDFSNIVASYPHYTVYKGTLSSGVEIAVVSTMITSSKEWSEHAETCFREKIGSLSRINHKNFINLLGFCEEEEPFTRMMVLEYAPNGTLYENLHAEDFEHIDWGGRMRIIMGLAYCIQHMHELSPPVVHPDLQSSSVLLTEDGAAKIVDMSVWHEVISEGKRPTKKGDLVDDHKQQVSAGLAGNVFNFGVLLLEIISGKLPSSEQHERSLSSSVLECIHSGRGISSLLDHRLNGHKEDELETICEVIRGCIQSNPRNRPSMREVTARLRQAIEISPVAATPRLSPLWWAELEIISAAEAG